MNSWRWKTAGKGFWDTNPCGGSWNRYVDFLTWIQRTEPYAFEITGQHEWTGKRVLDVGCGQGTLINYLPAFGATVFGVDMSISSLRRAAAGANELGFSGLVNIAAADAERLPFPDAFFDAVLCFGVLHHTPDTHGGVRELWRVLRPSGIAIVMLYRSGNPKWWMTRFLRNVSCLIDRTIGKDQVIADWLRGRHGVDEARGTALLELFGVPILKAFSNSQACKLFEKFSKVEITNHQPGFRRLADIIQGLRSMEKLLKNLDQRVKQIWGFYQVIQAIK
jgi:SAM-dependent methyltransferase